MKIDYTRYTVPEVSGSSSIKVDSLGHILQSLDKTLKDTELKLSVFDALKITKTVSSSDEFGSKKAALGYNNALIINTLNKFVIGSETYKRGDIVYKDNNGEYHTISSQTAGYYVPTAYLDDKLTFNYSTGVPDNTKGISGFSIKYDPGVYKQFKTVSSGEKASIEFQALWTDGYHNEDEITEEPIYPVIKVYYSLSDEDKYIECSVDYTLSKKRDEKNYWSFLIEAVDFLPFDTIWMVK
jgi:hypothetical protein